MSALLRRPALLLPLLALLALPARALEWKYAYGIHDFVVPEVDSHTVGINTRIQADHRTASGIALMGALDIYVDHDVDDLDPDHIPVWWMSNLRAEKKFAQPGPSTGFFWVVDLFGMRNTVSSVEKQYKVFPGLRADFGSDTARFSLQASLGYYFMEIDDDVPRTRGYDRGDFDHGEPAYSLLGEATLPLGPGNRLTAGYQFWAEKSTWLQQQARVELGFKVKGTNELVVGAEFNRYNFSVYDKGDPSAPGFLPILPWNEDLLLRVSYRLNW